MPDGMCPLSRDITSSDIGNNTIRSEDIHQGSIEMRDLSDGLKDRLKDRVTVVSMEQDFGPNASEAPGAPTRTCSPSPAVPSSARPTSPTTLQCALVAVRPGPRQPG